LKSFLLNNLYLVFFNPTEFPYFYEEYKSRSSEFLVSILTSISVSIGSIYINPPYNSFSEILIFPLFILHLFFVTIFPALLSYLIDYKLREENLSGEILKMKSYTRYSVGIMSFFLPISFIFTMIGLKGTLSFFIILFFLFTLFLIITSIGSSAIYKVKVSKSFSCIANSCITIFFLPIFLFFFYLITLLVIVIK